MMMTRLQLKRELAKHDYYDHHTMVAAASPFLTRFLQDLRLDRYLFELILFIKIVINIKLTI
jgi:hypothetical protein